MTFCRNDFLSKEDLHELNADRDLFIGPPEDMSSNVPVSNPSNPRKLIGGTAFERCGQQPVKNYGWCYSLAMTHQRQKALVGPTSSWKVYDKDEDADDEHSLNLEIRTKTIEVRKSIAWL